jgi:hypothetical protein
VDATRVRARGSVRLEEPPHLVDAAPEGPGAVAQGAKGVGRGGGGKGRGKGRAGPLEAVEPVGGATLPSASWDLLF